VSRYRLRFLLQELDLNGPEVVIGRSPDCQITIEDPLVSRQHARIRIDESGATVVDLGSRNGVRINGTLIRGEAPLAHNDRLRLGTQDLVFLVMDQTNTRLSRATGFMAHCPA
jgi:pSer/pThr/pTyr-binding forkhead associated (FHA) protein